MVAFGGVLIAAGWIVNSKAETLSMLYLGAVLAGIGGGAVYATCVGQAVKWFPGSSRTCGRSHRRGLWRGRSPHRGSDPRGDRLQRLPDRVLLVRPGAGRDRLPAGLAVAGAGTGRTRARRRTQGDAVGAQLHAGRGADIAGVLGALRHVRPGLGQRPDGDRADRADRARLQCRRHGDLVRRFGAVGGADRRQRRQWRRTSDVRLGVRPYRPRIHHGDRVRSRRRRLLAARIDGQRRPGPSCSSRR